MGSQKTDMEHGRKQQEAEMVARRFSRLGSGKPLEPKISRKQPENRPKTALMVLSSETSQAIMIADKAARLSAPI
jgi:hypothetical protein